MNKVRTLLTLFFLLLVQSKLCAVTVPQESYDSTFTIGEVRVTAIKQSRSLLRQPVTVTTIKRAEIERLNVSGMKGVSEIAPNFYMPSYGSQMTSSIYVRGIGARIDQPAVGLNIDNIPYLNKDNYDLDMVALDGGGGRGWHR